MENFNYFALMYLNDWYWWDKPFSERIGGPDKDDSLEAFHGAAKYYKVTRNFSGLKNEKRLATAEALVLDVKGPISANEACETVRALAASFQEKYGKNAISAASKLLWLRFKSPIIIFDGRAVAWLRANKYKVPYGASYDTYCEKWLLAFDRHEERIREACEGLINVKQYSLVAEENHGELEGLVRQRWFLERVFDKYLWFNAAGG
ncbi:hypothetical protein [Salinicola tamaricis]|uniref:hypothetical protein n=1 Tax=Salinicola tamaricis TaxID=1771309 RepID=UPI00101ADB3E|nr:hypothetical protein [Salinicola tamaricis]